MQKSTVILTILLLFTATQAAEPEKIRNRLRLINPEAVRVALEHMHSEWPDKCRTPQSYAWLDTLAQERDQLLEQLDSDPEKAMPSARKLCEAVHTALKSLPLLPDCNFIAVERSTNNLALPDNWSNQHETGRQGLSNRIIYITNLRSAPEITTLWQPDRAETFVGHLKLHWDAERLMFTSNTSEGRYRIYEISLTDPLSGPKAMMQIMDDDVDNYSGCWLADNSYLFLSTATMNGVPCVRGSSHIANIYKYEERNRSIRRITFDQEHNWDPTMLPDGSVMYLRWEYSDIPHFVGRILFTMNPDGTTQRELYGSNSYWPNSMFHAQPIPGQPHKFAAIVSGHHDTRREGELVIFDPSLGRHEADGAVQRIPGRGKKVEPVIEDRLVSDSWPKFLFPLPLNQNFYLVSLRLQKDSTYGIYLVDTFDNLTPLLECPEHALLEIAPLRQRQRPPIRPSIIDPEKPALAKIIDVYQGPGLKNVPRGTVKALRIFSYAFSYRGMGGQVDRVGMDGPWDVRRILGTVPVEPDGSAFFEVPANTPVAFQPLDKNGRALQLMRSWTTVMPGELQSCTGCHEPQNTSSGPRVAMQAMQRPPVKIKPWYGAARGFSFNREVQSVLDRACVSCHDGSAADRPDLRLGAMVRTGSPSKYYDANALFPPAYLELLRFVRGHTIESDMHLLTPCEFHAGTTELVQMLEGGHHGVVLTPEEWDRIVTWIDLNTPAHGTWTEIAGTGRVNSLAHRRRELMKAYAGIDEDLEDSAVRSKSGTFFAARPNAGSFKKALPDCAVIEKNTKLKAEQVTLCVATCNPRSDATTFDLGKGVLIKFRDIPPGRMITADQSTTEISKAFRASVCEVSNEQYACFDPSHDSRIEAGDFLQFSAEERGFPCNLAQQPVCRVSAQAAISFCRWLTRRTGRTCRLPTADEWCWLARAGESSAFAWKNKPSEFNVVANLADKSFQNVAKHSWGLPYGAIARRRPAMATVDDGFRVAAPCASLAANTWGLHDTIGNVREWTVESTHSDVAAACGGSWSTRPDKAGFDQKLEYPLWQSVYDTGFRVVMEQDEL